MKKALILCMTLAATSALILAGTGCASATGESGPPVTITYNAAFSGETPAGYLILQVDVVIENGHDEAFDISPTGFAARVGEYSYVARDIKLETTGLPAGGKTQGTLSFHVPAEAALPKTGFTLTYSGEESPPIRWVRSSDLTTSNHVAETADPAIKIAYSTDLMWLSAPGTQYLKVAPPGALFLVVEMIIENDGYESFHTNPDNFSVRVSSPILTVTAQVEEELIDWREVAIPNSGQYIGSLVFQVPTQVAQSFYQWEYTMVYSGSRSYDVRWTKIAVAKLTVYAEETDLEIVDLKDGESIRGKLAYYITPGLATDDSVYEMSYDRETTHNVQWFDRPDAVSDVNRNPTLYPVIKITYSTNVVRDEDSGLFYLMADVLIENKGYQSFITSAGHFFMEVSTWPH